MNIQGWVKSEAQNLAEYGDGPITALLVLGAIVILIIAFKAPTWFKAVTLIYINPFFP